MSTSAEPLVSWGLSPGTVLLGEYRIEAKLGDGAIASVYRARSLHDQKPYALKILDPLRVTDPISRVRFRRELEVLERLNHPGLARAFSLGTEGELEVLVLELIEGPTLAERASASRLSVEEAVAIAIQIADAVAACHVQGILHRDLKPANVVLHPDRGAVVLDFGLAWFSAAANLTRTGAVIGTPQYMAPEALRSALADPRADVYAIGAILFELIAGRPVYLASSTDALALAQLKEPPPRLFALRAEVGPGLSAVVERALAQRPEDRFATAAELKTALERRSVATAGALDIRVACPACGTGRIVHVPFCPGCGQEVPWVLEPGPFAVRIDSVADLGRAESWLLERHRGDLAVRSPTRRLRYLPAPLALGVSQATARMLMSEAAQVGLSTTLIHTQRLGGPSLSASPATLFELLGALGGHFLGVVVMGVLLRILGLPPLSLFALPAVLGLIGLIPAWIYVRKPLLRRLNAKVRPPIAEDHAALRGRLAALQNERSRRLAASAIARVAPLLLEPLRDFGSQKEHALDALDRALSAIAAADAHLSHLLARPRAALGHDLAQAEARASTGDAEAVARRAELEVEKRALAEVGIAHDLEVRTALAAIAEISAIP